MHIYMDACQQNKCTWIAIVACLISISACVNPMPRAESEEMVAPVSVDVDMIRDDPGLLPLNVRWGGTIASVNNRADGNSVVEIVSRPLSASGRPLPEDYSGGRFRAHIAQFIDPLVYTQGRELTVLGEVTSLEQGTIGDMPYDFPQVQVSDFVFWEALPETIEHRVRIERDWPFIRPYESGLEGTLILRRD